MIKAYIAHRRMAMDKEGVLRRLEATPWAVDFVSNLVYDDPDRCWRLLRDIAIQQPADDVMGSLGVTLDSLLREQPGTMDTIEQDVATGKPIAELVSHVTDEENIRLDVWARIEAMSNKL